MDKRKVLLDYTFLFNPDSAWNSLSAFEADLADFFAANGMEANIVKTIDGQIGRRILEITKMDIMKQETNFHNKKVSMRELAKPPSGGTIKKFKKGVIK